MDDAFQRPLPRLTRWDDLGDFMRELRHRGYSEDEITELASEAITKLPAPRRRRRRIATGVSLPTYDLPRCRSGLDCRLLSRFAVTDTTGATHYCCWDHLADHLEAQAQPPTVERIDYTKNERAAAHGRTEWVLTLTPIDGPCQMQFF
jgi:hypothetical protein